MVKLVEKSALLLLVGGSVWRLTHRRKVALIDAREREFHHHVVKNRVDPSRQSAAVRSLRRFPTSLSC